MITLISTPEYIEPLHPTVISRWIATESPNNFRLLRRDWIVAGSNSGGFLLLTLTDIYTGSLTNSVSVYCAFTNQMYTGTVTLIAGGDLLVTTDIPWVIGMNITYMNDNTLRGGYYFEGRLTINGIVHPLTIIASPDSFGYADLDVSGLLRIVTALGKVGDYSSRIMKETTKSGNFTLEYRECWYTNLTNAWEGDIVTSPLASPPIFNVWYYGECVRSEEQGSNLHEFVPTSVNDAPFLNLFDEPVYFLGLPFDLSFILPELAIVTPTSDITVTIKVYNSNNLLLTTIVEIVHAGALEGFINSLNIDPTTIPIGAAFMTAEITV